MVTGLRSVEGCCTLARIDCLARRRKIDLDNLAMSISMTEWRLAEAKNRISELVTRALREGPQRVRRHDAAVVILAENDYEKLAGKKARL